MKDANILRFQVSRFFKLWLSFGFLYGLEHLGDRLCGLVVREIQRSRVRFPALPDFLSSSGSGTGSTQPREPREVN